MNLRADLAAALGVAYSVESELGGGGMSHLFVARDHALDRRVVVKVVGADVSQLRSVARFRREVSVAASLQHPHIVSVLAAGEVAGLPYFIMPFVEGRSLRQRLEEGGPLPVREAVAVLRDVARACAYAHERGVVHRDIKPDNILLAGGSAMITDFGVAKALSSLERTPEPGAPLTHEGFTLGTPGYMAPEQVAGDPNVDARADLYAFGIVAYEMLTGRTPFHGRTPHATLAAQVAEAPPPIAAQRPDVPAALAALVMQCLEKAPARRPADAAEIVARLEDPAILSGPFAATVPVAAVRRRRRRLAGTLLALGAAALLAWRIFGSAPLAAAPERSVAVLPLANVGGDSSAAYLAAGLTDEIALALSRLPGVEVASRGAAAQWRGRAANPREIRRTLHVASYLDGSVQVSGGRLRLFAQLTDTKDGLALWSQRFEGNLTDVFAMQDSIASAIADALRARFGGAVAVAGPRGSAGTSDVEAYELFLRGRFLYQRRSPDALRAAILAYDSAVARDPGFARAYAGLADVYTVLPLYTRANPDSAAAQALVYVERAVALDSTLAEALASRGALYVAMWRWADAERDLRRALALDSTDANAWQSLAEWLMLNGRITESRQAFARAVALDPTGAVPGAELALAYGLEGRLPDALAAATRAATLDSSLFLPPLMQGAALASNGRPADAVPVLERARRLSADAPATVGWLGYALAASGDHARAAALRDTMLARASVPGATAALAHIDIGLGDTAQALAMLEWAVGAHDPMFASESLDSHVFDPIRHSERFAAVVRRVGLDASRLTR